MRRLALLSMLLAFAAGCASPSPAAPTPPAGEKLYFALEVRQGGRLVGRPQLLGETGRTVRAERRRPGAEEADYKLQLKPLSKGASSDLFQLEVDLELPLLRGHSEGAMTHGEEKKLQLGRRPGELEVKLLLMRVDSPEFRALLSLSDEPAPEPGAI
jgi:hypothetical protein